MPASSGGRGGDQESQDGASSTSASAMPPTMAAAPAAAGSTITPTAQAVAAATAADVDIITTSPASIATVDTIAAELAAHSDGANTGKEGLAKSDNSVGSEGGTRAPTVVDEDHGDEQGSEPEWVRETCQFLSTGPEGDTWKAAVTLWQSLMHFIGNVDANDRKTWFSSAYRPPQIAYWMQRHRKFHVVSALEDISVFADLWRKWWTNAQPDWRKDDKVAWPLKHIGMQTETWKNLAKGGKNGIVMVLIALVWWSKSVSAEAEKRELESAVEDVRFVLEEIEHVLGTTTDEGKDEEKSERWSKRNKRLPTDTEEDGDEEKPEGRPKRAKRAAPWPAAQEKRETQRR
ncbi:hypothetical protein EWM64_g7919 [Hericium alpestre]|uniref:Uncharacterized protein n=1 Tax=Hericium alpestre TaxID=135208 RepID=A0A4Y9ZPZ1_9AGAM|nr:hypothetical protein EWM64_g7919 [Hericium alpestre]